MPDKRVSIVGCLAWVFMCANTGASSVTQDGPSLYRCASAAVSEVGNIGAKLCDAAATNALAERIEVDNLQRRSGAMITEIDPGSVGDVAGMKAGDVIYRVGGVDVTNTEETASRIALIEQNSDTVVNFLRRGRPYRVKIREP